MCGIVGYFDYTRGLYHINPELFDKIIDTLAHRGPDGRGKFQLPGIGLGHRRLAILDTSEKGAQPMCDPDRQVWLVSNGEIYNFLELKKELEHSSHTFISRSDSEVLLHAYHEWELSCLSRLKGMFAFAIWDSRFNRLWLVRDHLGIKPLFYADYKGKIIFASEISAILSFPDFPADYDPYGIDTYFTYGYVPAPLTGYKHIRQLLPAQYLLVENGSIKRSTYWNIPLKTPKLHHSEQEYIDEFDHIFTLAVKQQMISDVPLGAFLSSGTDSFAVLRAMKQIAGNNTTAFSIGFHEKTYDELDNTKLAAEALGVKLVSKRIDVDPETLTEKISHHCLEPFADSSCLPTYLLCEMASKYVKVSLSGDGADELLAGYPVYKANMYAQIYRNIPSWIRRGIIRPLVQWLPDFGAKYTLREKITRFVHGAEQGKWRDHATWRIIFTPEMKKYLYTSDFSKELKGFDPIDLYAKHLHYAKEQGCSDLDCYLYADQRFYLPNDMLAKIDRMSMAHGLEVRVPFLDLDLINFIWSLPDFMKINSRRLKYILRKTIDDYYPPQLQRLPKSGFNMAFHSSFFSNRNFGNRYCVKKNLNYFKLFGKYHYSMIKYLLAILASNNTLNS